MELLDSLLRVCALQQDFSTLVLLTFCAEYVFVGGCPVHPRMFSSILGLNPLDGISSSVPSPFVTMSPDIAKCLGVVGWLPLVEKLGMF